MAQYVQFTEVAKGLAKWYVKNGSMPEGLLLAIVDSKHAEKMKDHNIGPNDITLAMSKNLIRIAGRRDRYFAVMTAYMLYACRIHAQVGMRPFVGYYNTANKHKSAPSIERIRDESWFKDGNLAFQDASGLVMTDEILLEVIRKLVQIT